MSGFRAKNKSRTMSAASFPDDDPYSVAYEISSMDRNAVYNNSGLPLEQQEMSTNNGTINTDVEYNLDPLETRNVNQTLNTYQVDFKKELEEPKLSSSLSHSTTELESQLTTSVCISDVQQNLDMGCTRMLNDYESYDLII